MVITNGWKKVATVSMVCWDMGSRSPFIGHRCYDHKVSNLVIKVRGLPERVAGSHNVRLNGEVNEYLSGYRWIIDDSYIDMANRLSYW